MSILDKIFGNGDQSAQQSMQAEQVPAQQAPAPTGSQSGAQPQAGVQAGNIPAAPVVSSDPNNPTVPTSSSEGSYEESPLAAYKDLWDNANSKSQTSSDQPSVKLNPADVQKVIAKADFASVITPEQLTAISEGGEPAQQAFMQAMNSVAQRVMLQSTLVNNRLAEQAISKAIANAESKLPDALRKYSSSDYARTSTPLLSNPAVKPIADAVQSQLLSKYPNATNEDITRMTKEFIQAVGEQFAPKPDIVNNSATGETDWENFFRN